MTAGIKANSDGSAAIQVGGSDAITITSGLNTTFAGTITSTGAISGTTLTSTTGTLYPLVSGTAVASTSGTSIDFTGIPSTTKRITVMFNGVSASGTSPIIVQLGSATFTTSGYAGVISTNLSGSSTTVQLSTGFMVGASLSAASSLFGVLQISLLTTPAAWNAFGNIGRGNEARLESIGGAVSLSGALDRVRITTVNGTDTFDAGTVNIMWE